MDPWKGPSKAEAEQLIELEKVKTRPSDAETRSTRRYIRERSGEHSMAECCLLPRRSSRGTASMHAAGRCTAIARADLHNQASGASGFSLTVPCSFSPGPRHARGSVRRAPGLLQELQAVMTDPNSFISPDSLVARASWVSHACRQPLCHSHFAAGGRQGRRSAVPDLRALPPSLATSFVPGANAERTLDS